MAVAYGNFGSSDASKAAFFQVAMRGMSAVLPVSVAVWKGEITRSSFYSNDAIE